MESTSIKHCQSCNSPLMFSLASNRMMCICCKNPCTHMAMIPLLQTVKRGELTVCPDCKTEIVLIDCPYTDCKCTFYANKGYRMGESCQCIKCAGRFRQVVCFCGQKINAESSGTERVIQGNSLVICDHCQTKFYFTTCNNCCHVNYSTHPISQGEVVKCVKCISTYVLLGCPQCNKSVSAGSFQAGKQYSCGNCFAKFDYTWCPICLQSNHSLNGVNGGYMKTCPNQQCRNTYVHIVCNKCHETLYMDKVIKGCEYNQKCARCKQNHKINYCMHCGVLHVNEEKCPIKEGQRNLKGFLGILPKQQKKASPEVPKPATDDKSDMICKVCLVGSSKYANQACGHLCVCQECYNTLQKKIETKDICILCRKRGQYIKIYTS